MNETLNLTNGTFIRENTPAEASGKNKNYFMVGRGASAGQEVRSLIEIDLSSIPQDAIINIAVIELYCQNFDNLSKSGELVFYANPVKSPWSTSQTWATRPDQMYFDNAMGIAHSLNNWISIDIRHIVQQWVRGELLNFGLMLYQKNTTLNTMKTFAKSGANGARIAISWEEPAGGFKPSIGTLEIDGDTPSGALGVGMRPDILQHHGRIIARARDIYVADGAYPDSWRWRLNGASLKTDAEGTIYTPTKGGTNTVDVVMTDTRGYKSELKSGNIEVTPYAPARVDIRKIERITALNNKLQVTVDCRVSSIPWLDGDNKWQLTIESKLATSSNWTQAYQTNIISGGLNGASMYTLTPTYMLDRPYDIRVTLQDGYSKVVSLDRIGAHLVPFSIGIHGIGAGKSWSAGALDVQGLSHFDGDIEADGDIIQLGNFKTYGDIECREDVLVEGTLLVKDTAILKGDVVIEGQLYGTEFDQGQLSSSNLDNITTEGAYQLTTSYSYTNAPVTSGVLTVFTAGSGVIQLLAYPSGAQIRYRTSTTWGDWRLIT